MKQTALISVSDKQNLVKVARAFVKNGITILSTGGTYKTLSEVGIPVEEMSHYTGSPEMMDGRVKTLHPKVHGGILALRNNPEHLEAMKTHRIDPIDFVIVNLYPFEKTTEKEGVSLKECIENIDVGGPTMIRAAAKNFQDVTVVVDPDDYEELIHRLEADEIDLTFRQRMALKVFEYTFHYDRAIYAHLSKTLCQKEILSLDYEKRGTLRYGANPHQKAKIYEMKGLPSLLEAKILHGKEMSFNNYEDAFFCYESMGEWTDRPCVSVVKHGNPCGFATGETLSKALQRAWEGDDVSAFGSIIGFTQEVDENTAWFLKGKFVEVVIAPAYSPKALEILKGKSDSLRLLEIPVTKREGLSFFRQLDGLLMVEDKDDVLYERLEQMTGEKSPQKEGLCRFAFSTVKHLKSNAISLCYEYEKGQYMLLGMGSGQPNRVDSIRRLAVPKAKENIEKFFGKDRVESILGECVLASDAFFPFSDSIEVCKQAGIRFIVQPGGSKKDSDVLTSCEKEGIRMWFTGTRHFLH